MYTEVVNTVVATAVHRHLLSPPPHSFVPISVPAHDALVTFFEVPWRLRRGSIRRMWLLSGCLQGAYLCICVYVYMYMYICIYVYM